MTKAAHRVAVCRWDEIMLTVNVAATDSQSSVNEDVVGYHGNAAWVIDGATGIGPALLEAPSDAAWLARTIDASFRQSLVKDPTVPTQVLVRQAILICRDALHNSAIRIAEGPHEHPSAAFAMFRDFGDHLELSGLGDCRIAYVDEAGQARLFSDTSLDAIEKQTLVLLRDTIAAEPNIDSKEMFERLVPQLRANRRRMNKPGGYWVLSTEPEAADRLAKLMLPAHAGQRFAIASDGFLRLVELFEVAAPQDLIVIDSDAAWREWLERLRAIEREPGSCRDYVRVKVHDDATFLNLGI